MLPPISIQEFRIDLPNGGSAPLAQCKELMDYAKGLGSRQPTVVGGDLNMRFKGNPNVQGYVPGGWFRKGDGKVQHILATDAHFGFVRTRPGGMKHSDHPWFLVELNRANRTHADHVLLSMVSISSERCRTSVVEAPHSSQSDFEG